MTKNSINQIFKVFISACVFLFASQAYGLGERDYYEILETKSFLDKTGLMGCMELSSHEFQKAELPFHSGFFKGNYWLELTIRIDLNDPCYISLGYDSIESADFYVENKGRWSKIGRTGRSLKRQDLNVITWQQAVLFEPYKINAKDNIYHIRIRYHSDRGTPRYISVLSFKDFQKQTNTGVIATLITAFALLMVAIIFVYFAITNKDKLYLFMTFMTIFLLYSQLHLKGVGTTFLWNFLAQRINSAKLHYFFGESALFFGGLSILSYIRESEVKQKSNIIMVILLPILGFLFITTVVARDYRFLFLVYNILLIFILAGYSVATIVFSKNNPIQRKFLLLFWTPAFMMIGARQIFQLLSNYYDSALLRVAHYDLFITYDVIYLLLILPSAFLARIRNKSNQTLNTSTINGLRKRTRQLQNEKEFNDLLHAELFELNNVIHNTYHLPDSGNPLEETRKKMLIDLSLVQTIDFLNCTLIMNEKINPNISPILLLSFFNECWKIHDASAKEKKVTLSVTASIPNDFIIHINHRILEMTILNFISLGIKYSPSDSKLQVNAGLEKRNFVLTMIVKSPPLENTKYNLSYINSDEVLGFKMIEKLMEYLHGEFIKDTFSSGTRFTISIPCPETTTNGIVIKEPDFLHKSIVELGNHPATLNALHTSAGKKSLSIFIAEPNLETNLMIQSCLRPSAKIYAAALVQYEIDFIKNSDYLFDIGLVAFSDKNFTSYDLLEFSKNEPKFANINWVFMLSENQGDEIEKLIEAGASACIIKPFTQSELLLKLQGIINTYAKNVSFKNQTISLRAVSDEITAEKEEVKAIPKKTEHVQEKKTVSSKNKNEVKEIPQLFKDANLSKREIQIAELILNGKSDKEIAETLSISFQTVQTHNKNLYKKLDVHSRIELINKVR